jgi:hypothetical protein
VCVGFTRGPSLDIGLRDEAENKRYN